MISEHITSQFFFKNNKNVLNNTTKVYLIEKFALIVSQFAFDRKSFRFLRMNLKTKYIRKKKLKPRRQVLIPSLKEGSRTTNMPQMNACM
jgi:hypothetical protein